ncbi:hypothetical protein SAMN04487891_10964 [Flagellimonas taeanensis]|jgi:hypothetical protein|uniref:Lipoprotein n=1 Tax=Flagellimonas taeanensis TaxID=1005926 RepID=A0A1M7AIL9_9FLAO|nr:hypothetical protein [Allomuricauda taeanensis]SFC33966.1 hypothetical protein SAMN04487891_10964 [Allomuricauda taeanensis]SHL42621.1 hypothetical protein SAMN05216293_3433 [Allomuricauda taeanensis]
MKLKTTLFALSLAILSGCQSDDNLEEAPLIMKELNANTTSSSLPSSVVLTVGGILSPFCTNTTGFIKNGDIEAILDGPASSSVFVTYNLYKKNGNSWMLIPPVLGGGIIAIASGDDRGYAEVCANQMNIIVSPDDCENKSLQFVTYNFKVEIKEVNVGGVNYDANDITFYNNQNALVISYRCPYSGGGIGGFND